MRSVKVQWFVGFKQKQWLSDEFFRNIIHIQTYNWTKCALCGSTLSGGLQAEVMAFRQIFSKLYTHSNIQLNKVCALWKYTEGRASSGSNGLQKKFFKTIHTFKHTVEWSIRSVKAHWVLGFKQKQWFPEEVFRNNLHIQTYNWTKFALCESTLSVGFQAEAKARRRSSSKHYTHSNIQLNKVCGLWKHTEWWASSRSNGFQKKFFETFYTSKHTIGQSMRSVKVHWVLDFKQKQRLAGEVHQSIIHIQTYNWTKYAVCGSTLSGGLQAEAMASRRSLFETFYTSKHTIGQRMRSVKVQWMVGFKQKQWLSEEVFQNIIHIHTYNWTKYALCESTVSRGLQAEAMAFRRIFSKHYTNSNIQLNKVCALWKYTEGWASRRSDGFQK